MTSTAISRPARAAFLKFYTGDYTAGTIGFDLEQRGFYTECLFRMWERKGGLPYDERWLARSLQCDPRTVRRLLLFLIDAGKLVVRDGLVTNTRMAKEIAEYEARSTSARDRTKIGQRSHEDQTKIEAKKSEIEVITTTEASADDTPRIQKPETRIESPQSPSAEYPAHVRPVDFSNAFGGDDEVFFEGDELRIVGDERARLVAEFDGDERRFNTALLQVAGQVQRNSRQPLRAQVRRGIGRIAGERRDKQENYMAVVAANKAQQSKVVKLSRFGGAA